MGNTAETIHHFSSKSTFYPKHIIANAMDDTRPILDSSDDTISTRFFILPDLVSHCNFSLSYHANGDEIAQQSVDWLSSRCPDLSPKQRHALYGLQAGELTAYCYHTATPERLRVVSDFMNYLFHLCVHDMTCLSSLQRAVFKLVRHVAYARIAYFSQRQYQRRYDDTRNRCPGGCGHERAMV